MQETRSLNKHQILSSSVLKLIAVISEAPFNLMVSGKDDIFYGTNKEVLL